MEGVGVQVTGLLDADDGNGHFRHPSVKVIAFLMAVPLYRSLTNRSLSPVTSRLRPSTTFDTG